MSAKAMSANNPNLNVSKETRMLVVKKSNDNYGTVPVDSTKWCEPNNIEKIEKLLARKKSFFLAIKGKNGSSFLVEVVACVNTKAEATAIIKSFKKPKSNDGIVQKKKTKASDSLDKGLLFMVMLNTVILPFYLAYQLANAPTDQIPESFFGDWYSSNQIRDRHRFAYYYGSHVYAKHYLPCDRKNWNWQPKLTFAKGDAPGLITVIRVWNDQLVKRVNVPVNKEFYYTAPDGNVQIVKYYYQYNTLFEEYETINEPGRKYTATYKISDTGTLIEEETTEFGGFEYKIEYFAAFNEE